MDPRLAHAVCTRCEPDLSGLVTARCGTRVDLHVEVDTVCRACLWLDGTPCPKCQPALHALYVRIVFDARSGSAPRKDLP